MKAVIQRVSGSSVSIGGEVISSIGKGFMILLGVEEGDTGRESDLLVSKVSKLRVFADENDKMNLSIRDVGGEILLVSQFTLCAACRHGNRPSFVAAMKPDMAKKMYLEFGRGLEALHIPVRYGRFGAMMDVALVNDGPVTILLEAKDGVIL